MEKPTTQDVIKAGNEGAAAGKAGKHFKTDCPYTYDKFPGMDYRDFDDFKRPLLNAWFDGWKTTYSKPEWA